MKTFKDPPYQLSLATADASSPDDQEHLIGRGRNKFGDFVISGTFDEKSNVLELR